MTDVHNAITLQLGDEAVVLKPSSDAAIAISRQFGGITAGFERIGRLDTDAIVFVIAAASGKPDAARLRAISGKAYEAGFASLVGPCARYLNSLLGGGEQAAGRIPKSREES